MSLIDDRYVCDECGGYRVGYRTSLSSACKCPDYSPVEPGRHQIGAPRGALNLRLEGLVEAPTTEGTKDNARND